MSATSTTDLTAYDLAGPWVLQTQGATALTEADQVAFSSTWAASTVWSKVATVDRIYSLGRLYAAHTVELLTTYTVPVEDETGAWHEWSTGDLERLGTYPTLQDAVGALLELSDPDNQPAPIWDGHPFGELVEPVSE